MKRCQLLFTPSDEAYDNLKKMKPRGEIFHTAGNTVVDALLNISNKLPPPPLNNFGLATCHRYETITNKQRLSQVLELINQASKTMPIIFVTHKPTINHIKKFGLSGMLSKDIKVLDMQGYASFQSLVHHANLVMTDGGSIQEECAYLNKPCLIIRNHTERSDGVGKNAVLWKFDSNISAHFLSNIDDYTSEEAPDWPSPSAEIIDILANKLLCLV